MAYGGNVQGQPNYTIQADLLQFSISRLGVSHGSNKGSATIRISGAKFSPDDQVGLTDSNGILRQASKVWWKDSTELWATIDLQGLNIGAYDVVVSKGNQVARLDDAFTVTDGPKGQLQTYLDLPN